MRPTMEHARSLLFQHFGYHDFRPAQAPVVRSVLAGVDTPAVLPTGAGKSVGFQVPALALGARSAFHREGTRYIRARSIAAISGSGSCRWRTTEAACKRSGVWLGATIAWR